MLRWLELNSDGVAYLTVTEIGYARKHNLPSPKFFRLLDRVHMAIARMYPA